MPTVVGAALVDMFGIYTVELEGPEPPEIGPVLAEEAALEDDVGPDVEAAPTNFAVWEAEAVELAAEGVVALDDFEEDERWLDCGAAVDDDNVGEGAVEADA